MDLQNIKWEETVSLQDGEKIWESSKTAIKIAKSFSYSEYTSSEYVSCLVEALLNKINSSAFAALCISSDREHIVYEINEIQEFRRKFDSLYWDVWAITSGRIPPDTDDLIDLIKSVKPNQFAVYLDRDGGMFVALC